MRMEELSDSRYIKNTDTVERYLLNLVQEYFKNSNIASATSREYIIKKAVERMKEEITFDSIGVLSITLPDGEQRTGAVTVTLEDLNGEPLISPKLSAFNVNFGTDQGTACEGNDPRLSDARKPLEHEHKITDIAGLQGILSTLTGKTKRTDEFLHEHNNLEVLNMLVYTGNKSKINLTVLETLEDKVIKIAEEIRDEIITYKKEIENKINEVNEKNTEVKTQINELKEYALNTNQEHYRLSKKYTDDAIVQIQQDIEAELSSLVTKEVLDNILNTASNSYTLVGTMNFSLNSKLDFNSESKEQIVTIDIDNNILTELTERGQTLKNCQTESIIEYKDSTTNKIVYGILPYIIFKDNTIDGSIQLSTIYTSNQLLLSLASTSLDIPIEIQDARITYNVYSKQSVTLV